MKKALIAMSGGVDSSVAALLMKEKGYDCIGATMKLFDSEDIGAESGCCSLADVEDARRVAMSMDIPYYVFNFSDRFKQDVIGRFISAYENGQTPNPCIDCNRYLKFDKLLLRARELDCDCIVTGHYARIEPDKNGRMLLKKAVDLSKDQSYVLYHLTPEQLKKVVFPLGGMTKSEVRALAERHGFVNAKKRDSQDICFVPDGKYADFITSYTGKSYPEGDMLDTDGNVIGRHKGIIRYTVGQRRGLGVAAGHPLYVRDVNALDNTVTLSDNNGLYSAGLIARDINLISTDEISSPIRVKVKARYRQTEQPAVAVQTEKDAIKIIFDTPQRALTKGQSAVLYDGDTVIGGGRIDEIIPADGEQSTY